MFQMQSNKQKIKMNSRGFTLIEVLIVIAIFSIGILAVAAMQMTSTKGNASARRITEATALAENKIENLIQLPYDHADLNPANNPHGGPKGHITRLGMSLKSIWMQMETTILKKSMSR